MKRREFLRTAAAGLAASAIAAPAIAQSTPELRWRLTASWPKSLDTLYGMCEDFAKNVADSTDNKFQIQVFAAGEIVPGLQVFDAVQNGTVEMGSTAGYYYWGKDPSFAFATAIPFGLNARQQDAWQLRGGGMELLDGLFADFGCYGLPMGNTGTQMGGWFRKEINTLDDLNGLKFRIGGFAGHVIKRLGVVPQNRLRRAISIRRWRKARSMPLNGSAPTTTRSSASPRSPNIITTPAGGRAEPTGIC